MRSWGSTPGEHPDHLSVLSKLFVLFELFEATAPVLFLADPGFFAPVVLRQIKSDAICGRIVWTPCHQAHGCNTDRDRRETP